ncbi:MULTISPECIES: DUF4148 domain-containing protein [Ramlibacter]|uniref:DUF4148 domain-containing protein n=1 Tax=Ramlibacter aquaticus TaxID=2780094 RepID=A0ABR9SE76_9BURK|nr:MULTISPECIES: DUF4148 domain-containing protein [Ramlibacter]MBE7940659.1 DUF4148 domain-containing protein [Ramlibacter aquaticus]
MNRSYTTIAAIAFATLAGSAMADTVIPSWGPVRSTGDTSLTRQQVQAETQQAIRSGTIVAAGERAATVRELEPGRFPAAGTQVATTREEVKRELAAALHHGDLAASNAYGRDTSRLY